MNKLLTERRGGPQIRLKPEFAFLLQSFLLCLTTKPCHLFRVIISLELKIETNKLTEK